MVNVTDVMPGQSERRSRSSSRRFVRKSATYEGPAAAVTVVAVLCEGLNVPVGGRRRLLVRVWEEFGFMETDIETYT